MSDVRFAKFVLLLNCAVPGALLAWDALHHRLGANPVNFAILTTGMLTLVFLSLTLLVTPVRRITGWNWLLSFRRTLGLYAFFYASSHFLIFFAYDRAFSLTSTGAEMLKRPYLIIGSLGLASMMPLAVTSTNRMVKRLGAKRWHLLHRLAYVAAIAGVVHFYMQAKADKRKPIAFAVAVGALLACRLIWLVQDRQKRKMAKPTVVGPAATPSRPRLWSGQLRVARIIQETHNVRTFRLQATDGRELPFQYLPGQYLNLSLAIAGKRVNRSYTIASSPTRPVSCELTIKREEMGLASRHLHDTLREGDLLNISAPAGRFTFTGAEADSIVLIAGGVGITPLMSILRSLTDRKWTGEIYFVYCVRQQNEIIFAQELDSLRQQFKNLHLCVAVSRPENGWPGHRGRINDKLLTKMVPGIARRLCYLCGPSSMMSSVTEMLRRLGVAENRIKKEAFEYPSRPDTTSASAPASLAPAETGPPCQQADLAAPGVKGAAASVEFSVSSRSAKLGPGQTLLEAGEALGLELDYECRSGICGRCKKRMLAGSVIMDVQDALSPSDKANNLVLLCQARATQNVTIEA